MKKITFQLHALKGGTKKERQYYREGLAIAEKVLNSEEFKSNFLSFGYQPASEYSYQSNFKKPKGMTKGEIYDLLMTGWDKFHKTKDGDFDVSVTLYKNRFSGTLGYKYANHFRSWINTKFFTGTHNQIVARIAGNIIHEYFHVIGFDHDFDWNSTREYTVPYAAGYMVRDLALMFLANGATSSGGEQSDEYTQVCVRYWFFWTRCEWVKQ